MSCPVNVASADMLAEGKSFMAKNILDTILETKRKEVADLRSRCDTESLKAAAAAAPRARNFYAAMTKRPRGTLNIIAEIKRASPSAGVIREDFDPVEIARQYAAAGADAISVLTDQEYFGGSLSYLSAVREAVDIPVLRKDFIIDACQVYQARAAGADAILLIAAALTTGELMDLMILAAELRMTTLLEVHNHDELMGVQSIGDFPLPAYSLLGINNRDLTTFKVDISTTIQLASLVGDDLDIISESGIKTPDDVRRLQRAGVKGILVGETLMRSNDVAHAVRELVSLDRDD